MKKEDFEIDLMPRELVLKLTLDLPAEDYEQKLNLIHEHFDALKVSGAYYDEVIEVKRDEQIAFIYWEAGQFDQSAFYYEKILASLIPEFAPNSYSMAAFMVIRNYRLIKNYTKASLWAERILDKPELLLSFSKLDTLSEYVDLLNESKLEFNRKYIPQILNIITDLGFPVIAENNPIESIEKIKELNRKWNLKIPGRRIPVDDRKKLLKEYICECEVGWYRQYAQEILDGIEGHQE